MTSLIVGASGATGRLLVEELLNRGQAVKIIVRSPDSMPDSTKGHANLTVIHESILDINDHDMSQHVKGCDAVVSCLGHNLTFKGLYGKPRKLVTDATRRLCDAIQTNHPAKPVKFVLMNTTGNSNRDLNERISFGEKCAIALLRLMLPPHVDNEKAADYLRTVVGQNNPNIEWVAVRPDGLINETEVSDYKIFESPIRSAIFDAGKTSRINVAHFMAELINSDETWNTWQGRMPVIYNASSTSGTAR